MLHGLSVIEGIALLYCLLSMRHVTKQWTLQDTSYATKTLRWLEQHGEQFTDHVLLVHDDLPGQTYPARPCCLSPDDMQLFRQMWLLNR